jgi:hypothetical protein
MRIAKELHKSIEEVMALSVLEVNLWAAYFVMEQEAVKNAHTNNRHRRKK